jgi:hypothetical protein
MSALEHQQLHIRGEDDRLRSAQHDRESRRVIDLCATLMIFCALAFAFAIAALMAI